MHDPTSSAALLITCISLLYVYITLFSSVQFTFQDNNMYSDALVSSFGLHLHVSLLYSYLQFREKRIEQEKELIQRQNKWLSEELKSKTDELVKLRKEKVIVPILGLIHYYLNDLEIQKGFSVRLPWCMHLF